MLDDIRVLSNYHLVTLPERYCYHGVAFLGALRTYEDQEKEEIDEDELEGSRDENMSDDKKISVAHHSQIVTGDFLSKQNPVMIQD